eukprot:2297676-Amphidinium_carterae.1
MAKAYHQESLGKHATKQAFTQEWSATGWKEMSKKRQKVTEHAQTAGATGRYLTDIQLTKELGSKEQATDYIQKCLARG